MNRNNYTSVFLDSLNKIVPKKPKPKAKEVMIEVRKTPVKQQMRQYGDKGYKPSNGTGVTY